MESNPVTPFDFGARGDGFNDDGPALAEFLNAIKGRYGFLPTIFLSGQTLELPSNSKLKGWAPGVSGIGRHPSLPTPNCLILNVNPLVGFEAYDIGFYGDEELEGMSAGLCEFVDIQDSLFMHCFFKHHRKHLFVINKSNRLSILGCTLEDWGSKSDPDPENLIGYDGGCGILMFTIDSKCLQLRRTKFLNGQWTGLHIEGPYHIVSDCLFSNLKEAGIFTGPANTVIERTRFEHITKKAVSHHGLEIGGYNNIYKKLEFNDISGMGLMLTTPINSTVEECEFSNIGGDCISTRTLPAGSPEIENVLFHRNILHCNSLRTDYGMSFYNYYAGTPMRKVQNYENQFRGLWKKGAILWAPDAQGEDCVEMGNTFSI